MSFVNELISNKFTYEPYEGSCPNCSRYFERLQYPENNQTPRPDLRVKESGWYFPTYEYVVVWYDEKLVFERKNTQAKVRVKLVNLSKPLYNNDTSLSTLYITIPINILHYFFIGSVWKNGEPIKQVRFNEYFVTANQEIKRGNDYERDNVSYCYFSNTSPHHSLPDLYTIKSDSYHYKNDKNLLIKIQQGDKNFIIHPLQLFSTHYGVSADIKRILTACEWSGYESSKGVREYLKLDENEPSLYAQKHVIVPKHFRKKDAIFLYHLKYDLDTQSKVKQLHQEFRISDSSDKDVKVPFWHNQPVQLKIHGIELGDTVLCVEIIGLNQPEGEDITCVIYRKEKSAQKDVESSKDEEAILKRYKREIETENLFQKFANNEPNNRTAQAIKKQFEELGKVRIIKQKLVNSQNNNPNKTQAILPQEATEFGFGEHYGAEGNIGLAVCYLDSQAENQDIRFYRLWEMAKDFAALNRGAAHWFTPNLGYRSDDNLVFLSLENELDFTGCYPEIAFVIQVKVREETFYIVDFSQKSDDISISGIAYKADDDEDFISLNNIEESKLSEILCEVISKEQLPTEYISEQNKLDMKISTFKHPTAESSNWVYNAISKLVKRKLNK